MSRPESSAYISGGLILGLKPTEAVWGNGRRLKECRKEPISDSLQNATEGLLNPFI